ncbi:MAG TPA: ABC transporter substrate-binding protein [Methylomirabilota bacterium]|jgi:putative ABC transport system substrate-binding protein|nr:ABC transporter substrate-binding protein [Methylomirabilota bacterium]
MERRIFMAVMAGGLLAAPLAAEGQQAGKILRIGFLSPSSPSDSRNPLRLGALQEGLRELGYVEGQNLSIESRWAEGKYERLPGLAAELVRLKVDVIVTYAPPAIQAAKEATATIPIVMGGVIDPVATGFVASLARPGGNITGLSLMAPELVGKQLEILKEVVPKVTRVAVLGNPANAGTTVQLRHAQDAARTLRLQLQPLQARGANEIDSAFAAMTEKGAGAVVVLVDAMFVDQRTRIADLATRRHLPSVYGLIDFAEAGGLMFYGANDADRFRRAAYLVDKILKGAKPADLPIEQPTKFDLVINLKTAKALGLTIPQSLLQRAYEVIQ